MTKGEKISRRIDENLEKDQMVITEIKPINLS